MQKIWKKLKFPYFFVLKTIQNIKLCVKLFMQPDVEKLKKIPLIIKCYDNIDSKFN